MPIRKIKAHEAVEDGDYIRIERHSHRFLGFIAGGVLGFGAGLLLISIIQLYDVGTRSQIIAISVLVMATIGAVISNGKEVRRVPKADLVEIKKYSSGHVTVVLDDERVKRQRREGRKDE